MRIRWVHIVVAAVVAEVAAVALLILLVAVFGPSDSEEAAEHYAEQLGRWVGPLGGAALCFLGGYWVARSARTRRPMHGLLVGVAAALIDIAMLLAFRVSFQWLFVASNVGRVLAGWLGGWAATLRGESAPLAQPDTAVD
jgi:hypothetical protein